MSRTKKPPVLRKPLPPTGGVHQDKRKKRKKQRSKQEKEAISDSMEACNDHLV